MSWLIFFIGCCACFGNIFSDPEVKSPPPISGIAAPQTSPMVPGDVMYDEAPSAPPVTVATVIAVDHSGAAADINKA